MRTNGPLASVFFLFSILLGVMLLALYKQGIEMEKIENAPRYFCDGSTTMGYAEPGTPEAAACWIEGGKK